MEFPRGKGAKWKNSENSRGLGEYGEAPWNGKSWGMGGQTRKTLLGGGGYGYFLEPHREVRSDVSLIVLSFPS